MSASTYVVVALVAMYVDAMATCACKEKYNWIASAALSAIWPVSIPAAILEISALQNNPALPETSTSEKSP